MMDNSACAGCHTSGGAAGAIDEDHLIPIEAELAKFQYNIDNIAFRSATGIVEVTFSVTNPTNGNYYDILADPEFTAGSDSRLGIDIGWDTSDYSNTNAGVYPSLPIEINALTAGVQTGGTVCPTNCTFQVSTTLPAAGQAAGSGAVAIEGHPAADIDGDLTYSDPVGLFALMPHQMEQHIASVTSVASLYSIASSAIATVPPRKTALAPVNRSENTAADAGKPVWISNFPSLCSRSRRSPSKNGKTVSSASGQIMRLFAMGSPPPPRHPTRAGLADPSVGSRSIIAGLASTRHRFV